MWKYENSVKCAKRLKIYAHCRLKSVQGVDKGERESRVGWEGEKTRGV